MLLVASMQRMHEGRIPADDRIDSSQRGAASRLAKQRDVIIKLPVLNAALILADKFGVSGSLDQNNRREETMENGMHANLAHLPRTSWPQSWNGPLDQTAPAPERTRLLLVHDGVRGFGYELADLEKAGLPAAIELEILTVSDLFLPPMYFVAGDTPDLSDCTTSGLPNHLIAPYYSDLKRRLEQASAEAARLAKNAFPHWSVRHRVSTEIPLNAVLGNAKRWQPDLVVVGSANLSWFELNKLRVLTRRLISEARCSVRVVRPPNRTDDGPSRILIGFDGSRHSAAAIDTVLQRHWRAGVVFLVCCSEPIANAELNWFHDDLASDRLLQTSIAAAKSKLEQAGLTVHTIVDLADSALTIVDAAKQHCVESVFVGTRELGVLGTLLYGSVSASVAARANCSVEIVRAAAAPKALMAAQRLAA